MRLTSDGVAHDGREHRHIARLDLAGLVAALHSDVGHGEGSGARLYEPCIALLASVLYQGFQELLLLSYQCSEEERSGVLELCHFLSPTFRSKFAPLVATGALSNHRVGYFKRREPLENGGTKRGSRTGLVRLPYMWSAEQDLNHATP